MDTARIIGAIAFNPLFLALVGIGIAALMLRKTRKNRVPIPVTLRATAAAIVLGLGLLYASGMVRLPVGYGWLSLAYPLVVAAIGIAIFGVVQRTLVAPAPVPSGLGVRRTWRSFVSTKLLASSAATVIAVVATTIASASAARYFPEWGHDVRYTEFGTQGSMTQSQYGWTYGTPVLVGIALLVAACAFTLHRIARPPLAATGALDRVARSNSVATLALASLTLAFGRILSFVGSSGMGGTTIQLADGSTFEVVSDYAAFAMTFAYAGFVLEILALVLLLGLAFNLLGTRITNPQRHTPSTDESRVTA